MSKSFKRNAKSKACVAKFLTFELTPRLSAAVSSATADAFVKTLVRVHQTLVLACEVIALTVDHTHKSKEKEELHLNHINVTLSS